MVGVISPRFVGTKLDETPDLWLPLKAQSVFSGKSLKDPESGLYFSILARLRNTTTVAQAQAEFSDVYRAIQRAEGDEDPRSEGVVQPIAQRAFALHDQI